ncbi:hypothetical protein QJV45_17970 [Listeria booriae]|uniref:hypothetical protein n=1 Tax=Listeria booriae TaxID=1552123 RepID=UPI0028807868|nr:hypothetical protein [Listeria booriae]MDT0112356.1 hypothetical protein [Listeria booriae]
MLSRLNKSIYINIPRDWKTRYKNKIVRRQDLESINFIVMQWCLKELEHYREQNMGKIVDNLTHLKRLAGHPTAMSTNMFLLLNEENRNMEYLHEILHVLSEVQKCEMPDEKGKKRLIDAKRLHGLNRFSPFVMISPFDPSVKDSLSGQYDFYLYVLEVIKPVVDDWSYNWSMPANLIMNSYIELGGQSPEK